MTRIKINKKGFEKLRKLPETQALLEAHAARIAAEAGDGFETRPTELTPGVKGRARVAVVTASVEAMKAEAKDRTLTKVVGGRRVWTKR